MKKQADKSAKRPSFSKAIPALLSSVSFFIAPLPCKADAQTIPAATVSPAALAALASAGVRVTGKLVLARQVLDIDGAHILVLSRRAGRSEQRPNPARDERIDLFAALYRQDSTGQWRQEWTIRDANDCPELDMDADFFASEVAFTDLNGDGHVEVTVPYRMFCNGGIDSSEVKVILREGATKLAVRGQSQVFYPKQAPFGGEHTFDDALLRGDRAAYKAHLEKVWNKVSVDKRR